MFHIPHLLRKYLIYIFCLSFLNYLRIFYLFVFLNLFLLTHLLKSNVFLSLSIAITINQHIPRIHSCKIFFRHIRKIQPYQFLFTDLSYWPICLHFFAVKPSKSEAYWLSLNSSDVPRMILCICSARTLPRAWTAS